MEKARTKLISRVEELESELLAKAKAGEAAEKERRRLVIRLHEAERQLRVAKLKEASVKSSWSTSLAIAST